MIETLGLKDLEDVLDRIRKKLKGVAREVYVFGSAVENCAIPFESDFDILVVVEKDVDVFSILRGEIGEILDKGLTPHVIVVRDFPPHFRKNRMVRIV